MNSKYLAYELLDPTDRPFNERGRISHQWLMLITENEKLFFLRAAIDRVVGVDGYNRRPLIEGSDLGRIIIAQHPMVFRCS